jgi:hypothetical protein
LSNEIKLFPFNKRIKIPQKSSFMLMRATLF